MTVTNKEQAWAEVNKIFPTDYEKDEASSVRAGHDIYRHRELNYYNRICDLGNRLEVLTGDYGEDVTNIWIEQDVPQNPAIAELEAKLAAANERIKQLRRKTGTNLSQADYEKLASAAGESGVMTEERAKILINDEFGFEVSRIRILHEAEIDKTEDGARYITLEKVPREPLYEATDWNYIRFNVRGCAAEWYYEMIGAQLYEVSI